jgi:hypothetical protein
MRGLRNFLRLVLLGGIGAMTLPTAAMAVSVSVNGSDLVVVGGAETNTVDIDGTDMNQYAVRDSSAGVTAGVGCATHNDAPNTVFCGDSSTVNVKVQLGGGDDSLTDNFMFGLIVWSHTTNQFLVDMGEGNNSVQLFEDGARDRSIITGDGDNTIRLAAAPDKNTIATGNGNNKIGLAGGQNLVALGDGDNSVSGGNGHDTIVGGRGHNVINEGTSCTANDCGVGSATIEAVDGGADQITCGIGADIVYADQFDTVSSQCTTVHHVKIGGGHATRAPHAVAYKASCRRKSGRKVCVSPAPLHNHRYHGRTSQGQPITISTDRRGTHYSTKSIKLRFLCATGDGERAVSVDDVFKINVSDRQSISRKGTFSTEDDFDPSDGWTHEVIYLVGAFKGHTAHGTIVGNTLVQGVRCTTGAVGWSASG